MLSSVLKDLRTQAHMTQRQLAAALNIHFSYISKIENDACDFLPSDDLLKRMALVLGTEEDALLIAANKLDIGALQKAASESIVIARFLRALIRGEISDEQIARLIRETDD